MSIQSEITRLETARNTIRDKFVELGISEPTDKLDVLAAAAQSITMGTPMTITVNVDSGSTVTATKGSTIVSGTSVDGQCVLTVPEAGDWVVIATLNGQTSGSKTVSVNPVFNYSESIAFVDPILENNSWDVINAIASSGKASEYWNVGDRKKITLNGTVGSLTLSNYVTYAYIIGIDHNSAREGTGKIHFQIGFTDSTDGVNVCLYHSSFAMNSTKTNSGGWNLSKMRNTLCGISLDASSGTFISCLPADLRASLKSVTKYTNNTGNAVVEGAVTSTTDYIFLLSEYEAFGTSTYSNPYEKNYQSQYAYYANGNSLIKYRHDSTSTTRTWWLRSPHGTNAGYFVGGSMSGGASFYDATINTGFAPCFCV